MFRSFRLLGWRVGTEVVRLLGGLAEDQLLVGRGGEVVLAGQQGLGVDVVAVAGDFEVLVDPVSVLLDDVAVELVHCEFRAFPPGVDRSAPPGSDAGHAEVPEVLEELSFVDLADSVAADWDEMPRYAMRVEEEHGAERPNGKRAQEGVGLEIALYEIIEISGKRQST